MKDASHDGGKVAIAGPTVIITTIGANAMGSK